MKGAKSEKLDFSDHWLVTCYTQEQLTGERQRARTEHRVDPNINEAQILHTMMDYRWPRKSFSQVARALGFTRVVRLWPSDFCKLRKLEQSLEEVDDEQLIELK
jgi:hypothetical protein